MAIPATAPKLNCLMDHSVDDHPTSTIILFGLHACVCRVMPYHRTP